jgi:hypothetical protein
MGPEIRRRTPDPKPLPDRHVGQGAIDEQVTAAVYPEAAEINVTVGIHQQ